MAKPYCIFFAGAVGSGKSPIANFLSYNLGLSVFEADLIRTEVKEDLGRFDVEEFERRRDSRLEQIAQKGQSFILASSVDRRWKELRDQAQQRQYDYFLISLNLSYGFIEELFVRRQYRDLDKETFNNYIKHHQDFLDRHFQDVGLVIDDHNYPQRLTISLRAVEDWLKSRGGG